MSQHDARIIAVVGATGLQGGAVTRRLLRDHWPVRALTRNPDGKKARALAQLGAEVVQADLSDPVSPRAGLQRRLWRLQCAEPPHQRLRGGSAAGKAGRRGGQAGGCCPARLQRGWSRRPGQRRWVLGDQDRGGGVHQDPRSARDDSPPHGVHGTDDRAQVLPPRLGLAPHAEAHGMGPQRWVAGWPSSSPPPSAIQTASSDAKSCWPATSNPSMHAGPYGARWRADRPGDSPCPVGCSSGLRVPMRRPCGDGSARTRLTLTRDRRWRSILRR